MKKKLSNYALAASVLFVGAQSLTPAAIMAEEKTDEIKDETAESDKDAVKNTEDKKEEKENSEENAEKTTDAVKKAVSLAAQAPDYEIKIEDGKPVHESLKAILTEAAEKTNAEIQDAAYKAEAEKEKEIAKSSKSDSPLDALKMDVLKTKKEIRKKDVETKAEVMLPLGTTSYKEFSKEKKKDISKNQENFLYGDMLVSMRNYDSKKYDENQNVDVEYRQLSSIHIQMLKIAESSKNKESLVQSAVSKIMESPEDRVIKTETVSVKNKNATPPKIEAEEKVKLEQGETLDENEIVSDVTDADGNELDYEVNGDIDYEVPGVYNLEINATDIDGNQTTQNVEVEVMDDFYQRIADAALAQQGVYQDCTMAATNAIYNATGVYFHDWPIGYASLGTSVTEAELVPGDIIIYGGNLYGGAMGLGSHVAIYVGNGQAVHGGWGGSTVLASMYLSSAQPIIQFIHMSH